jgi:hypothetical protein
LSGTGNTGQESLKEGVRTGTKLKAQAGAEAEFLPESTEEDAE